MIRGVAPFEQHRCTLSSFSADVILYKLGFFNSFASSMQGFPIFVVLVVCPWIFLCLLGFFIILSLRLSNAGFPDFCGLVWLFVRGSFCIYSADFRSFFFSLLQCRVS